MRTNLILIALLTFVSVSLFPMEAKERRDSIQSALKEVDKAIANKKEYHKMREGRILKLKNKIASTSELKEKYDLYGMLFLEYLNYQADSALHYIDVRTQLIESMNRPDLKSEIAINKAEVMGVMGMYTEAIEELESLQNAQMNDTILAYYYRTYRACYGWVSDYIVDKTVREKYLEKTELYRDSIVCLASLSTDYEIQLAEKTLFEGDVEKALDILEKHSNVNFQDLKHHAYLHFTFAEAYEVKRDTAMQIYHLAKASVLDLQRAAREYAALQKLAKLIYLRGDVDRAYEYLNCAMEDAVESNARLRSLEVTEIYPIIDKAWHEKERLEKLYARIALITISVFALFLIAALVYLYYWMKKLQQIRRELHEANLRLTSTNKALEETGKIKEMYIARYLERCVGYMEKQEQYRRSLEKLAKMSKLEDLFKAIRAEQFLKDERKDFYNEFDKSFLELFPTFITDFNNLLSEDGKIFPKQNELLNTELRIFALIRLGVTDSNKIAHFLGYSLATVYNYRSKIRNRSVIDKDRFEQTVAVL